MKSSDAQAPYVVSFVGANGQEVEHVVPLILLGRCPLAMPTVDPQLQKEQWQLTQALDRLRATRSALNHRPGRALSTFGSRGSQPLPGTGSSTP